MPSHSTALSADGNNGAISTISVQHQQQQPSQVQQQHQGDSNSEASTSPLNASNIASDGINGVSNNINSQHYMSSATEATSEIMTALNNTSPSMQQTQIMPTGSIIIKTEDSDDSPMGEVTSASIFDAVASISSKVFKIAFNILVSCS